MYKRQHTGKRLKLNHSSAIPRYIISLAVETDKERTNDVTFGYRHKFRRVHVIKCRLRGVNPTAIVRTSFDTPEAFWRFVYEAAGNRHTTWLVGHNMLFNLITTGMAEEYDKKALSIDKPRSKRTKVDKDGTEITTSGLTVLEGPPTIIGLRVAKNTGRIVCVDTLNWFSESIPAIQESIGLAAFNDDPDGLYNVREGTAKQLEVEVVHKLFTGLVKWNKAQDFGMFRYTSAAQAMAAYRHKYMKHDILVHDNMPIKQLEKDSYFGGRSEVFKLGKLNETVYQLDTNSLFPFIMRECQFPWKLERYDDDRPMSTLWPYFDASASIAEVVLYTSLPSYPVRTERSIIYPTGRFRTTLAGPELQQAFRRKEVLEVGRWAEYSLKPLFVDWVDDLWQMRCKYRDEGNKLYEQFTKRILNSLYGKFGQMTAAWVNVPGDHSMLPWERESRRSGLTHEWTNWRCFGDVVQKQNKREIMPSSMYCISAFVTSYARRRMDFLRWVAGPRSVYYQGVDCLVVNGSGYRNLSEAGYVHNTELGKLRIDCVVDNGEILGCMDYRLGDKTVISSRNRCTITHENGKIMQEKMYALDGLFNRDQPGTVRVKIQPWQRHAVYDRGNVQPDGWVSPLTIGTPPTSSISGV